MSTNLTDNDRKVLAAAWYCFESPPKVSPFSLASTNRPKALTSRFLLTGQLHQTRRTSGLQERRNRRCLLRADQEEGACQRWRGLAGSDSKKARASKGGKGKGKRTAEEAEVDDGGDDDEEALDFKTKKAKKNVEEDGEVDGKVKDEGEVSES